jgi:hypothetical protein
MEELILRFPHVAEQIFQQLDNKDLAKSRQVERLWLKFIDERNYPWLRIVNIPTILQDGDTYMHLAAQCGQMDMFEIIHEEENKNAKHCDGETPFLVACRKGHLKIALIVLLKKADELQIDLNSKDKWGQTAFHLACRNGHSKIAEMIMNKSSELKIDLNIKDVNGWAAFCMEKFAGRTAFHVACAYGHSDIAEMIMKESSALKINLNIKDNYGCTAFHLACMYGGIRIVDMMIEQSESLELDLKAENSDGETGYQMARRGVVNLIQTKMPCLAEHKKAPPAGSVPTWTRKHFSSCCIN